MPSTYTDALRLTLQADGENASTWGDITNTVFELIEQAIAGATTLTTAGGSTTLSANDGASDQSRNAILIVNGTLSSDATIVIPNENKIYIVSNQTSGDYTLTVETATDTTSQQVIQGTSSLLWCDGNNNVMNIAGSAIEVVDSQGNLTNTANLPYLSATTESPLTPGNVGITNFWLSQDAYGDNEVTYASTITLDLADGNFFNVTLTGNTTMETPSNAPASSNPNWTTTPDISGYDQIFYVTFTQNATGNYTVGFNSDWLFPNGIPVTVSPTPNATSVLFCMYSAVLSKVIVLGCLAGYNGSVVAANTTITENTMGVRLYTLVGSPSSSVNVSVTINPGVVLYSPSTSDYALDVTGFKPGSVINLINNGYILGKGGNGGAGGSSGGGGASTTQILAGARGRPGGGAINGPSSGTTLNITNNGYIWGGGGGGGGGGCNASSGTWNSNGGGGGAGAGGALGGDGGLADAGEGTISTHNGGDSNSSSQSGQGAGGAGGGSETGESGGDGGTWGSDGDDGTNGTQSQGGAGGAGGAAVSNNSGTVNFVAGGSSPNVLGSIP